MSDEKATRTPNKERIRLWVTALRSGRYPQGKGRLRSVSNSGAHRFCCKGVAIEVATSCGLELDATFRSWRSGGQEGFYHYNNGTSRSSGFLPNDVMEWFGFTEPDRGHPQRGSVTVCRAGDLTQQEREQGRGKVTGIDDPETQISAAEANDDLCLSFLRIANLVERHYKLLEA